MFTYFCSYEEQMSEANTALAGYKYLSVCLLLSKYKCFHACKYVCKYACTHVSLFVCFLHIFARII